MNDKIKLLLDKMNIDEEHYQYFNSALVTKIKIKRETKDWNIFLKLDKLIPLEVLTEIDRKRNNLSTGEVKIIFEVEDIDNNVLLSYYPLVLSKLKLRVKDIFSDSLKVEDGFLIIEVDNKSEEEKFRKVLEDFNNIYKMLGYKFNIDIKVKDEDKVMEAIKKDLVVDDVIIKKTTIKKSSSTNSGSKDEDVILGRKIREDSISIKNLLGEDNNVIIDGYIFGVETKETKTDFKIITLKLTDYNDSIFAKIFTKDSDDFARLGKELKVGKWFKFRGYTKNDNYAKELVFNIRDINKLDKVVNSRKDDALEKRVELHAHTKMSQMDGVIEASDLVKTAIKWGHKAIAITDHNGAQAYPDVYHAVCAYNKGLAEGQEHFKAIYGTELTMIDDSITIVTRPNKQNMLEQTYVVFDFETTGFNAGGDDSIIEIGAVKIHDGEIIERYDELINPGRSLPERITAVTNITDEMLAGKDNEENAIKRFIAWFKDAPMVAHNAKFDVSFLEMAYKKYNLGEFKNPVIDTLELSRTLDSTYARHSLSALVKRYEVPWDEEAHHRGDYDAEGTALVFHKMMKKLSNRNIDNMDQLDLLVSKDEIYKYGAPYHVNILVKNKVGLKNLFKIISYANTTYLYKTPRILRSVIEKYRDGLLVGAGCYESEVFTQGKSKSEDELSNIIRFYDYVEVQPLDCYCHLVETGEFSTEVELAAHLEKIIRVTKEAGKIIVATGDVHNLNPDDKIYREIIVNQKVPGGGRHPLARNGITNIPNNYLRTTNEMLDDFKFLNDEALAKEIVITNTNKIADMIEEIEVIIDTGGIPFSPKIENSKETVTDLVYTKAHSMYGDPLPDIVKDRIENELKGIINGGFDVIYLIAQKLVKHSNDEGYLVGSRGSVGSSFVATMMGITEVNSLPAHYLCKKCKYSEFVNETGEAYSKTYSSGYDLPDKKCPKCGEMLGKEGQDMPFATFLGFNADKVPDIDLNFSGDNQASAHAYTKVLFGEDNVYRAGTIGTVADKTAYGFVQGYLEEHDITGVRSAEIERLAMGCTGVKRTTGQHPGGIVVIPGYMDVFDFTPFQYPADDPESAWRTTHFDYHAIDQDVLKLDILGHDDPTVLRMLQDLSGINVTTLPMDDKRVFSLLCSPKELGVSEEEIMCPTGTLGLPELGTKFVINMLTETKPKTFSELVKISGLSHGTDVWAGNASELIANKVVPFKDVIGCRDDIMVNLINWGMAPKDAFKIMEFVRKGKPTKEPEKWPEWKAKMEEAKVPDWYIESCHKIKYMFPKAHACAYVISAMRIAWFKVYQPMNYYAAYFSIRVTDFDIVTMMKGYEAIKARIEDLEAKGYEASNKETNIIDSLKIALEMSARGFKFGAIDLGKSDATKFLIDKDNSDTLIPPFKTIDGLGDTVAKTIVSERDKKPFISIEDVLHRGKVSQTLIDKMIEMGILNGLPESNQLSLF
jgi:DNA polymerase-3 subunit alpha (Gram-positive type)